jgi:hypothetical protein
MAAFWARTTAAVQPPPSNAASVLTSTSLEKLMPYVGNGFIATHPIVGSDGGVQGAYAGNTVFMAGVFNGHQFDGGRSHRAGIPGWETNALNSSLLHDILATIPAVYSLDLQRGVLQKKWGWVLRSGGSVLVDETHYAHRQHRNLLVHEINLTNTGTSGATVGFTQSSGPACGGP